MTDTPAHRGIVSRCSLGRLAVLAAFVSMCWWVTGRVIDPVESRVFRFPDGTAGRLLGFSRTGELVRVFGDPKETNFAGVELWNTETGARREVWRRPTKPDDPKIYFELLANGRWLSIREDVNWRGKVKEAMEKEKAALRLILDLETGQEHPFSFSGPPGEVDISANGRILLATMTATVTPEFDIDHRAGCCDVIELGSGRRLGRLDDGIILGVSPNGRWFVMAANDQKRGSFNNPVSLWEISDGGPRATALNFNRPSGSADSPVVVHSRRSDDQWNDRKWDGFFTRFSEDGSKFAVFGEKCLRIWTLEPLREVLTSTKVSIFDMSSDLRWAFDAGGGIFNVEDPSRFPVGDFSDVHYNDTLNAQLIDGHAWFLTEFEHGFETLNGHRIPLGDYAFEIPIGSYELIFREDTMDRPLALENPFTRERYAMNWMENGPAVTEELSMRDFSRAEPRIIVHPKRIGLFSVESTGVRLIELPPRSRWLKRLMVFLGLLTLSAAAYIAYRRRALRRVM